MVVEQGTLLPDVPAPVGLRGDARDAARRRMHRALRRDVIIPPVKDAARREKCRLSLRAFCETYLAGLFTKPWCTDHLKMIGRLEEVILRSQRAILVMPRGTGKSTLTIAACLWAILYGHRMFLVILCDVHAHSIARMESVRTLVETNELLTQDFPGPCVCARALEGNYNRAKGQTVRGERTHIHWGGTDKLIFPTIQNEPSSGSIIAVKSMDKAVRGLNHTRTDGTMIRPDVALLDDPISLEEAWSERIVTKYEKKVMQDVVGLAGPDTSIACIYLGTKICKGDLTTRFSEKPEWRPQVGKLMNAMPEDKALWETYRDLRVKSLEEKENLSLATEFYAANREAMDAGAQPGWFERFRADIGEISAVQCAMDLLFEDEAVFWAEYQNEPRSDVGEEALVLEAHRVEKQSSGLARGVIPDNALALAAGWDVGKHFIHWVVLSAAPGRIVNVIDYGVGDVHSPAGSIEAGTADYRALELALLAGLRDLRETFLETPYRKASGDAMPILYTLIDARYLSQVVEIFCRESGGSHGPVMGRGTARDQRGWTAPPKAAVVTPDGQVYSTREGSEIWSHTCHSDNYKQIVHAGYLLTPGEPGAICVFEGERRTTHQAFAHHIVSERQQENAAGRLVWAKVRGRSANHWLDAHCYGMAALSLIESRLPAIGIGMPQAAAGGFAQTREVTVYRRSGGGIRSSY